VESDVCDFLVACWTAEVAGGCVESAGCSLSELVSKDFAVDIQLERVLCVHRATAVFCDPRAANFAVLQSHPNAWSVMLACGFDNCPMIRYRILL